MKKLRNEKPELSKKSPLCYKAKNWIDSKKAKDEPIEAEVTEVVETDEK